MKTLKMLTLVLGLFMFLSVSHLQAETIYLDQGWSLKGTSCTIDVSSFQKDGIEILWKYKSGNWLAWSPNNPTMDVINQYGVDTFSAVEPYEGFWVKASYPIEVEVKNNFVCTWEIGVNATQNIGGIDLTFTYPKAIVIDGVEAIGNAGGGYVQFNPDFGDNEGKIGLINANGFDADGSSIIKVTIKNNDANNTCFLPEDSDFVITNIECIDLNGSPVDCNATGVNFVCN